MNKSSIKREEMKIVGISVRTSYSEEINPESAKIGSTIQKFYQEQIGNKISKRVKPGNTYSIYTNYESDETGSYTYFFGEEVESFDNIPEGLDTLTIPEQKYAKFNVGPGPMPNTCIEAWHKIWKMNSKELGGKRKFIADFEAYDERSIDPSKCIFDIYVGIEE